MSILRMGSKIYRQVETDDAGAPMSHFASTLKRLAAMSDDEAEVAAHEIGVDIGALALYLKEQRLGKDYDNAMQIAERFEGMANAIAKKSVGA